MAFDRKTAEANCCFNHAAGAHVHRTPKVKGKPFVLDDHREELNKLGLTRAHAELRADAKANKKPPGTPKTVNGAPIYPARHFA